MDRRTSGHRAHSDASSFVNLVLHWKIKGGWANTWQKGVKTKGWIYWSQVFSVFVTESVVRAVILKTTFVQCTTTLTNQQIPCMCSTDWLSHLRLPIYCYEYLGTNVWEMKHILLCLSVPCLYLLICHPHCVQWLVLWPHSEPCGIWAHKCYLPHLAYYP